MAEQADAVRDASMGAGPPNPHLARGVSDLAPGTALDAGCGTGAEAIWLAARGWQVTAVDIATEALARAAERAAASGVAGRVRCVRADLCDWEPDAQYDLVATHYVHPAMPQLNFYDRIASWVAPAGTLFIVGHLHRQDHASTAGHGGVEPPAEASATVASITARLDPAVWELGTAQESQRVLNGRAVHDVVVKATRRH